MTTWGKWLLAGALGLPAACGGGGVDVNDIDLDPIASTTTTSEPVGAASAGSSPVSTMSIAGPPASIGAQQEWVAVTGNLTGTASECGNVAIASQPDQDVFVVGVALHGLWSVAPGTDQWSPLGEGGEPVRNRLASIVADPDNPGTYWESGNYGDGGVYRTDDGGASFRQLGDVSHLDHLGIDFSDPQRRTMLVGTHERSELFRSTDGGDTWRQVTTLPAGIGYATAPWVLGADTYLLGTTNGDVDGIYRSTDAGQTWTRVFEDSGVVGSPVARGGTISWLQENGGGVVTSSDGGARWTSSSSGGAIASIAIQLVGLPDGSLATLGTEHVVRSTDGGATWERVGPALPYTPNHIAYSAGEQAYYVSRFDCSFTADNPVAPDAILRLTPAG